METLMKSDVFLVIIVALGLIVQRKNFRSIVVSLIKVSMGYSIINFGSSIAKNSLSVLSLIIRRSVHAFDIIPNNETMVSIIGNSDGKIVFFIMIIAMLVNIIICKFTRIKYIFLNGYYIFYMAGMMAILINNKNSKIFIMLAGAYLGIFMSILPFITSIFIKRISKRDDIGLAHFGSFACIIGGICALIFKKREEIKKEKNKISFMRDSSVLMAVSMFVIYLLAVINVDKGFLNDFTGETDKLYIAFKYSINFTVSFYLIVLGVRMMTDEILYSFKGIAEKIISDAKPALDAAVFFVYKPEMIIIGFICSLLAGIITLLIQIKLKTTIVVPAVTAHLFSGGTASIFGYSVSGRRGAVLSSFVHGVIISVLPIFLLPILKPNIGLMRTCYADSDFSILAMIFNSIMKLFFQ
ncbi:PTS ascorbate transporter subunit IIC [Clostridium carboxidivorans P7]|uniref:Ascorbate-specific PTS system EIIC component n=1 Tax=Clostridium carboxidivorans P7 TaxID=536227 RepID=C6PWG8_9CLOT|nr:PTS transporter subunit IIC [Clostridium carboxidivorans]AKN30507.1 PTS ascorbate transporter subunit IIC [Clostridium carboxidivorans P7]EET86445.1 ascorbate-specific PTS system enzyme IIC [Clostridium carboxidivorans P7]EFG86247.1 membrane protein, putative [Clostridium carboxidivorans P7]